METLRNHSQHFGFPSSEITFSSSWTEESGGKYMEYLTIPYVSKVYLAENIKFKKKVLEEMPDKLSLMPAIRSYIESMSLIQNKARELSYSSLTHSRELIKKNIDSYYDGSNEKKNFVFAIKENKNKIEEKIYLCLKWDDIRPNLVRKTNNFINLSKRYVSTNYLSSRALKQQKA